MQPRDFDELVQSEFRFLSDYGFRKAGGGNSAPEAWTDDRERLKREATAEAMLGDYQSALPKLTDLVTGPRVEQNLLFVAIQVLYRMHIDNKGLNANNKALFADLVKRHQALGGPNVALVDTYRRFVLR